MIERIINNQLYHLFLANIKELIREPAVLFWGIVFPILMSMGLGLAFTKKKDVVVTIAVINDSRLTTVINKNTPKIHTFLQSNHVKIAIDKTDAVTYKLVLPDDNLGNTTFIFKSMNWKTAMVLLKRGNLNLVMDEVNEAIRYHFDPMNSDAQLTYLKLSRLFGTKGPVVTESSAEVVPLTVSGTR